MNCLILRTEHVAQVADLTHILCRNLSVRLVNVGAQTVLGPEVQRTVLTLVKHFLVESSDVTLQCSYRAGNLALRALLSQLQMFALLVSFQITAVSKTLIAFITFVRLDVGVNLTNMSP